MPRKKIPAAVVRQVAEEANYRCGYCLSPQRLVMARLEVEHIIPVSKGGSDRIENLWLACPICNGHKSDKTVGQDPATRKEVTLFNPRKQNWNDHFCWAKDGIKVVGKTPVGRATVIELCLDTDPDALTVRSFWLLAGWHPPES